MRQRQQQQPDEEECGICLQPLVLPPPAIITAPCGFAGVGFHGRCLAGWCERSPRCPHCNRLHASAECVVRALMRAWGGDLRRCCCWVRGPTFVCMSEGPLPNEEQHLRGLERWLRSLGFVPRSRCGADEQEYVRLRADRAMHVSFQRAAVLCWRGQGRIARDGLMLSVMQRRLTPQRRAVLAGRPSSRRWVVSPQLTGYY